MPATLFHRHAVVPTADRFQRTAVPWERTWHAPAPETAPATAPAVVQTLPAPETAPAAAPALPKVSIHLPLCNEPPDLVLRTLDALSRLDYPDFEVLVIDSNTSDPALWEPVAEHCARLGARFRFFLLGAWPGGRAGALSFALGEIAADAAWIAVLDNGCVVHPDWLRNVAPHVADPSVGLVRCDSDDQAGLLHPCTTLVRRAAIEQAGGWAAWTVTAEAELGLRLAGTGWLAIQSASGCGHRVRPADFAAVRRQRIRHARGAAQICRMHWATLLSPLDHTLPLHRRWALSAHWLPWFGDALGMALLVGSLAWSLGLILDAREAGVPAIPLMLLPIVLFGFRATQLLVQCRSRPRGCRVGVALAELALVPAGGRAVWDGLWGRASQDPAAPDRLRDAPIRQDLTLLLLTWSAAAGVGFTHGLALSGGGLWCLMLLVESVPSLAAVTAELPVPARGGNRAVWPATPATAALPAAGARRGMRRRRGAAARSA